MKFRFCVVASLLAWAAPALPGGAGPMWVFPVARLCIAQDVRYAETLFGRWILGGRLKLASPQFTQCAREKQWIPSHICTDLMSLDAGALSRSNLERLGAEWSGELRVLQVAGPYVESAVDAETSGRELPSCP
jgi:hypothetical protein